jgi:hypothetical protein
MVVLSIMIKVAIVEEYDRNFLFVMFVKCYFHLHLLLQFASGCAHIRNDKDCNLNIF